jgi:TPR repeat protein
MKIRHTQLVYLAIFSLALLTAAAQTAGIDEALLAKANAGDATAEVLVGQSFAADKGVVPDLKQAAAWYRKAAEQGDAGAQGALGVLPKK